MPIFNGQWLSLSSPTERGISYVRLQDIDRIYYGPRGRDEESGFVITVFANGSHYSYSTAPTEERAIKLAEGLMLLIEAAFGRIENCQ